MELCRNDFERLNFYEIVGILADICVKFKFEDYGIGLIIVDEFRRLIEWELPKVKYVIRILAPTTSYIDAKFWVGFILIWKCGCSFVYEGIFEFWSMRWNYDLRVMSETWPVFCGFVKIRVFVGISVFIKVFIYRTFVYF